MPRFLLEDFYLDQYQRHAPVQNIGVAAPAPVQPQPIMTINVDSESSEENEEALTQDSEKPTTPSNGYYS